MASLAILRSLLIFTEILSVYGVAIGKPPTQSFRSPCLKIFTDSSSIVNDHHVLQTAAEIITNTKDLFSFETIQLTDGVLANLSNDIYIDVPGFSFLQTALPAKEKSKSKKCKTYPDDPEWPSEQKWNQLDALLGGALIKTVPEASLCYHNGSVSNSSQCQTLTDNWGNSSLR